MEVFFKTDALSRISNFSITFIISNGQDDIFNCCILLMWQQLFLKLPVRLTEILQISYSRYLCNLEEKICSFLRWEKWVFPEDIRVKFVRISRKFHENLPFVKNSQKIWTFVLKCKKFHWKFSENVRLRYVLCYNISSLDTFNT